MRILFTCVGRRVELIQAFRNASHNTGIPLEIYGADISDSAPALFFCDHSVVVPEISNVNYIPKLKEVCYQENIDALIPTIDTDLLLLSQNKGDFGKTKVLVSEYDKVVICRDKKITANYFRYLGLMSPDTVDTIETYHGGFPAFIKPKNGSSSVSAYKVNDKNELLTYAQKVHDYILQPFVAGTEYTVDVCCDFGGSPVYITPRIRLAVRSGEVLKTQIDQDERIICEVKKLVRDFRPCGQITIQLIRENSTGLDYYIEINPRFGGGAPLSIKAGADSAEAILRMLNGEKMTYMNKAAEDKAIFSRFDQSIRIV